jgi:hypothetical protein
MSNTSRRHTGPRVRRRRATRPHVEGLEARFAAGTVIDLFGSALAGLGDFGQPGVTRPSKAVTAGSDAGQRPAATQPSLSPIISPLPTSTAPKRPDGRRSSITPVSPVSSPESTVVVDPRLGSTQDPAEAAWDRMGATDVPQRDATPTGPIAPRVASAGSGATGNWLRNPGGGTLTTGPGGSAAGGGGVLVSAAAPAAPRSGAVVSPTPALAKNVAPSGGAVAGAGDGGAAAAVAAQNVTGNRPGSSANVSPVPGDAGRVVLEPSSFSGVETVAPPAIGQAQAPVTFLENRGQGDLAVKFVASTSSLTASFEEHAIGLRLGAQQQDLVRLAFEGASAGSRLAGEGPASDPGQVQAGGAAFSSVRYTGLFDGIDVRVDDAGGKLQYELFVAPGADVSAALIHADGGGVKVDADGSLAIQAPGGILRETAPVSWDVLPDGTHRPVESHFRVDAQGNYGFEVVGHDPTLPLVIDPILVPAPAIVAPANGASVTEPFNISWSSVTANPSGVTAYNWQVSTSSTFTPIVDQGSVNSPTTQDVISGLANGTYFWRVQAVDSALDQGAWSATQSFTITGVNAGAPAAPVLAPTLAYNTFHPREAGSTWWTPVPGAATYLWETSQGDPNFGWSNTFRQDNVDSTAFTFDMGFEGTFYSRVYAVSADGVRSQPSNVISYTYAYNNPIGPAPGLVSPISGETVTLPVTLQWANVPNPQALGYDVEIADDPGFRNIEDLEVQQTFPTLTIDSLTPGTKYWRVTSDQGDSAPATVNFAGAPAVTAPSATGTFTVTTAPATPVSLSLEGVSAPQAVPSGTSPFMALQLTAATPSAGAAIALTSSNPAVAPVPSTVTLAGFGWGHFQIPLGQVTTPTPVTITATLNGVSTTGRFTVLPPALKDIRATPVALSGGTPASVWVDLPGPAPAGGAVVSLSSDSPSVIVPATMTVPAGVWSASVPVTTTGVAAPGVATITATYNGGSQQATITVTPPLSPASVTVNPISRIGSDPGNAAGLVNIATASAYDQTFQLTSSNPAVAAVPATATVSAGSLAGGFPITTSAVAATTIVTITATGGGASRSVQFPVYPAGTAPSLSSVTVDSRGVAGGTAATGTVLLNSTAPAGGLVVPLSSNSPEVTVPASVTVPAGASSATFPVNTTAVTTATTATISGTLGATQSATLVVTPSPAPILTLISLTAQNLVGGGSATGRVALSAAALSGGAVVTLTSDTPGVTVPASVTIPADTTAVLFPVTTSAVTATTAATITASFGGDTQSIRLNVSPPQTGPVLAALTVSPPSVTGLTAATATVTLSAPAPAGGAAVFFNHNSQAIGEDVFGINVVVPAGATSVTFPVDTYKVSATMVAGLSANYGGVTQTATLTVTPTAASSATLSAVSLNPVSVTGGSSSTGNVTLTAPAPAGGLVVALTSNNTAAATVPTSLTVAAGATSATFAVTTTTVTASTAVAISATAGAVTRSATLAVNPVAAAMTVSGVGLNPSSVTGGNSSTGTVTLSGPAPSGGLVVTLASNNTGVGTVPASVTVAAGATSATFTVATKAVTSSTSLLVSATGGGVTRSATLTVNPAVADTVGVTKAEYTASKSVLLVEATSTSTSATLQVFQTATNQLIGTLTNNGGGKYTGQFSWPTNPQNIAVKSSLGGSSSKAVTLK